MGSMILDGSEAIYIGPGKTEEWILREGVKCTVIKDTPFDALRIPVIFELEEEHEVSVLIKHINFTDKKMSY